MKVILKPHTFCVPLEKPFPAGCIICRQEVINNSFASTL